MAGIMSMAEARDPQYWSREEVIEAGEAFIPLCSGDEPLINPIHGI